MSTTEDHSGIPGTAVEAAPGLLWWTNLQQYDLSVPGGEMIRARVGIEPDSPPIRHFHPREEIITSWKGRWSTRSTAGRPRCTTPVRA